MVRLFAFAGVAAAGVVAVSLARADVPPPYDPYGIGAGMEDAQPFPKIVGVAHGGPAATGGLKNGDGVIAIDGTYSRSGSPFYFFAKGLWGPKNSVVELVVLRDRSSVIVVKIKRTIAQR